MNRKLYIGIGFLFLIATIFLIATKTIKNPSQTAYSKVSPFSFVNTNGKNVSNNSLNGKVYVVEFFFSTCLTICIDMSSNLMDVQAEFKDNDDFKILSFTVDPEHDTNEVLRKYSDRHNANPSVWSFIKNDIKKIYDLARNGFKVVATEGDGGPGDFIHTKKFIVVDKKGIIRGYYDGTDKEEVQRMIKDIKNYML